jgi:AraC family ethanolamine operon transcriptional activator
VPDETVASGLCFKQVFPLFEQLAEATQGWDLNFRQLSATSKAFRLEQFSTDRMLFSRACFGSHFYQAGGPTLGFRTFALHSINCTDFRWCGEAVHRHSLIVFPSDGEFESVSLPGFDILTLSLSNELLEQTAELQFQRPLSAFLTSSGQVCHLATGSVRELRAQLHRLSGSLEQSNVAGTLPSSASMLMEQELAQLVLASLERGEIQSPRGLGSRRMKPLVQVMELIGQRPPPTLGVAELVAQAGVSRRTLEHAFRDGLGMSPAAYLKATRLRALHKDFLAADPGITSVHGVCSAHGFTHEGQLAADYRKLFGELPFATLRRT